MKTWWCGRWEAAAGLGLMLHTGVCPAVSSLPSSSTLSAELLPILPSIFWLQLNNDLKVCFLCSSYSLARVCSGNSATWLSQTDILHLHPPLMPNANTQQEAGLVSRIWLILKRLLKISFIYLLLEFPIWSKGSKWTLLMYWLNEENGILCQ